MFEKESTGDADDALLSGVISTLAHLDQGVEDGVRIDRIRLLEQLKAAAAAAQARETAAFADSQRAAQLADGVPAERASRGVAAQVALARRVSPYRAQRELGWARILTAELPATFAALQAGQTTEWRAMIIARETGWLSREHRAQLDAQLAPDLPRLGDRRVEAEAKKLAYRLDPHGYVDRLRTVADERRVTLRPAPDTMTRLTTLLPVKQGVAAYASLTRAADTLIGQGDPRTRGQVMADTLVERVTGQTTADTVPVEINLIITDQTLFGDGEHPAEHPREHPRTDSAGPRQAAGPDEPGVLIGHGPIPAPIARDLALDPEGAPRWIRRLYTAPDSGQLIAMESRRRLFTTAQQLFVRLRDHGNCRTPWCDAPIRHTDHIHPAEHGGPTSIHNGQGACAACNYAKQAPGWTARTSPAGAGAGAGDQVTITTPTGHQYQSHPPDPPGTANQRRPTEVENKTDAESHTAPNQAA
ncbi:DUF222 domain-containing protein [uncultured Jatrophihabitans sp.]|uniref:HNH endonuclease n=1 Tax=uncultured Jatrophihabitans sp. TaxID=1610747 RepID=UPI0035CCA313